MLRLISLSNGFVLSHPCRHERQGGAPGEKRLHSLNGGASYLVRMPITPLLAGLLPSKNAYRVLKAITVAFGSGACGGNSICNFCSDWVNFSDCPFEIMCAETTFGCNPLNSSPDAGQSKT